MRLILNDFKENCIYSHLTVASTFVCINYQGTNKDRGLKKIW